MRILSLYIIRRYLISLGLALAAFVLIFLVVDLMDRLNDFLDRAFEGFVILRYYLYYIPYVVVLALPMASLLACLFSVGDLSRRQELTAMKAAGLSLGQILGPVGGAALAVSLLALAAGDRVVPEANRIRAEIERGGALETSVFTVREHLVLRDVNGQVLSVDRYNVGEKAGSTVMLDRYDRNSGRESQVQGPGSRSETRDSGLVTQDSGLKERITARTMRWDGRRWEWRDGLVRRFGGDREAVAAFASLYPEGLTLRPEDIARPERKPEEMGYAELRRVADRRSLVGMPVEKVLVELHLKVAFPFASLIMVVFGAPLAASLRRTGRGTTFGICLLLSFIFYGSIKGCQALGWNGLLPPALAAWLPNAAFAGVGAFLFSRAHR